jgi:hypothetical protein
VGRVCSKVFLCRKRRRARRRHRRIGEPLGRESSLHLSAAEVAEVFHLAVVAFSLWHANDLTNR